MTTETKPYEFRMTISRREHDGQCTEVHAYFMSSSGSITSDNVQDVAHNLTQSANHIAPQLLIPLIKG